MTCTAARDISQRWSTTAARDISQRWTTTGCNLHWFSEFLTGAPCKGLARSVDEVDVCSLDVHGRGSPAWRPSPPSGGELLLGGQASRFARAALSSRRAVGLWVILSASATCRHALLCRHADCRSYHCDGCSHGRRLCHSCAAMSHTEPDDVIVTRMPYTPTTKHR